MVAEAGVEAGVFLGTPQPGRYGGLGSAIVRALAAGALPSVVSEFIGPRGTAQYLSFTLDNTSCVASNIARAIVGSGSNEPMEVYVR